MYDIIGDIHGHAVTLKKLLIQLGYVFHHGTWRFPRRERQAIFVGDYIDRGPDSPEVLKIVRNMVDAGTAQAIIGNHEYNATAWHTTGDDGLPLRRHSHVHRAQYGSTLQAYGNDTTALIRDLTWFRRLPLYIETPDLRVVHATWDQSCVDDLGGVVSPLAHEEFFRASAIRGTREHRIIETLLKGTETALPQGVTYRDKDGTVRSRTRTKWWLTAQMMHDTLGGFDRNGSMIPLGVIGMPPADSVLSDVLIPYDSADIPGYHDDRPVFFGHYWLTGQPAPQTDRVACVDYSVGRGGKLCAYRFDGDLPLRSRCFVCV